MSRTYKDKPWKIARATAPQALLEPYHFCDRKKYVAGQPVLDKNGNKQYRTEEHITRYLSYSEYAKAVPNPREYNLIPRRQPGIYHTKKVWVERALEPVYGYYPDYIFVRGTKEVLITTPGYWAECECTINEPKTKENDWGWNLPCSTEPVFYKMGGTPFTRARKHRHNGLNRRIGKQETKTLTKLLFAEAVELEDVTLTNYVTRKRNDWD